MPKLTERPFKLIAQNFPRLINLNLYADADLPDQAFRDLSLSRMHLTKLIHLAFHNLEFLDLCGCKKMTDDSMIAIAKNYPKLTYLNLVKNFNHNFSIVLVYLTDRSSSRRRNI